MTKQVEFFPMPRGSFRADLNETTVDVWKVGGEGWRYTIYHNETGHYLYGAKGFSTLDAACSDSISAHGRNP